MRTLYHFEYSPFSRRVRLALAFKGLPHELREGRANPAYGEEARKLWAPRTMPVLVDEGGRVIGDSNAIAHYLDVAYPADAAAGERPLWPTDLEALHTSVEVVALVDSALNTLVDVGTRFYALREHTQWSNVRNELVGRAQAALDVLGARVSKRGPRPLTDGGWCAPDIWLYTAIAWLEGLPSRAAQSPNAAQIVSLAWAVPAPLVRWTEAFREREDVRALG